MDLELLGKTALVSGASSGIGAAAARLLAAEGADVIIGYHRDRDGAEDSARSVRDYRRQAWLCRMDLADRDSILNALADLPAGARDLDCLILSAGQNIVQPVAAISAGDWEQVLAVNLSGPFYLVQAALPMLQDGAAIVTVASVAAHTGAPHHAHYAAAKAGLVNLTKSLARELAPRVRVNCVAPGITLTPMGQDTVDHLAADYAERKLLAGRYARPEEIAAAIVFLASPRSGFIYGATLDINGGRDLR